MGDYSKLNIIFHALNYIKKMSNYKNEDWCGTWDSLFWKFIDDYKDIFKQQYRLSIIYRNLDRMDNDKKIAHRKKANRFLSKLT